MHPRQVGPSPRVLVRVHVLVLLLVLMLLLGGSGCGSTHRGATPIAGPSASSTAPRLLRTLAAVEQATAAPLVLAADARHLYWTSNQGIVAAEPDGSSPHTLVPDVFVTSMAVVGDDLLYRAGADTLWRIPVAGGRPRRIGGDDPAWHPRADADADVRTADSLGEVTVGADGAALVLHTGDQPRQLVFPPAAGHRWLPRPPVLVGDTALAADTDPDGNLGIWRLPRTAADGPTLIAATAGAVHDLLAIDGALVFIEVLEDEDHVDAIPVDQLVRVDPAGRRTVIVSAVSFAAIAADGQGVAYAVPPDDYPGPTTLWLAEPGAGPRRVADAPGSEVVGLALAPRALYWIQDGAIWTAPRTGGRPTRFHAPPWGDAGGSGLVHLVVDGASVYFSSVGLGATGVHRTRGGADATELWPPPEDGMGDELVQVGGALFVVVGHHALWRVPMDGTAARAIFEADDGAELITAVGGGGWLYVSVRTGDAVDLLAVDPTSGDRKAALHTGADDLVAIAADHDALYLAFDQTGWLVRVPHPDRP